MYTVIDHTYIYRQSLMSLISDCLYVHNTKMMLAHVLAHMHTCTHTMTWSRRLGEDELRSRHVSLCYEAFIYIAALLLLAETYVHMYTYTYVYSLLVWRYDMVYILFPDLCSA